MTNAELIKALRWCGDESDEWCVREAYKCPLWNEDRITDECKAELMRAAADALEAAERLLDQNTKRCEALRKQLRESHENYEKHLNELEKQMPKEGEWRGLIIDGQYWAITCSNCHQVGFNARTPYCPNCGARMRGEQE